MSTFVGRYAELRTLLGLLDEVAQGGGGRCICLSGPAGEGKTRLTGEFLRRARATALIYPATDTDADEQRAAFLRVARQAPLPRAAIFDDFLAPDWDTVLRLLADAVGGGQHPEPRIVIIDNAHLLIEADPSFPAALRRAWAAHLSHAPVLLIVAGRGNPEIPGQRLAVDPFNPAQLARLLQLDPATALEAHLASGGHPDIVAAWPLGADVPTALADMVRRSPSAFETRAELQAGRDRRLGPADRTVRGHLGASPVSRAELGRATQLAPATLDRSLRALRELGVVTVTRPLSARHSREARYHLADPYQGIWARIIPESREELDRGRADLVVERVRERWPEYRADPLLALIRQAMNRLAQAGQLPGTAEVGGYWTRFDDVRLDLVGLAAESPSEVTFVGSVRWSADAAFDHYDLATLIASREKVPGTGPMTPLVGVTRLGSVVGDGLAAVLGPTELLTAWEV